MTNEKPKKPAQFYWFTMVLYPDNRAHLHFINKVLPVLPLRVVGILHDRDSLCDDDVLLHAFNQDYSNDTYAVTIHEEVKYKKAHWHLVLKVPAKRTLKGMQTILETYGVEGRFIASCEPFLMMSYLTHRSQPYKTQYEETEIFGDMGLYQQYSTYSSNQEFTKFYQLMLNVDEDIKKGELTLSYVDICYYIHANGLGHLLTGPGNFMYNNIIREKIKEINNYGLYYQVPGYGREKISDLDD